MPSIEYILNAARSVAGDNRQLINLIEEIQWYQHPAGDPAGPQVIAGDWNDLVYGDREEKPENNGLMGRLFAIFEAMGLECEWNDEVIGCSGCYAAIRTQPDSYGWAPEYVMDNGEFTCLACMDDTGWQDELDGIAKSRGVLSVRHVAPSEYGYTAVRKYVLGWDGWHREETLKSEADDLGCDYFLQVTDGRQFGASYLLWVPDGTDVPGDFYGDPV